MSTDWFSMLDKAKKSCIIQDKFRKVHYALEDGREMVEEYNMETGVLSRRAWRIKNELGGEGEWDIEIGDPEPNKLVSGNDFIKENANQPFISRRVTRASLEWRIRNLPYKVNVYSVTAEPENNCMTVRTTNKKYFKRIVIPDLERVYLLPQQDNISFTHRFNTLIINYKKPDELLKLEKAIYTEIKKLTPQNSGKVNDCKPS